MSVVAPLLGEFHVPLMVIALCLVGIAIIFKDQRHWRVLGYIAGGAVAFLVLTLRPMVIA